MIYKVFNVALELKQTSTNPTFTVIEGDTGNKLHVTVTDGGSALDLTGCRIIAVFSKTNGMSMQDSGVEDGGIEIGGTYNNEVTISLFPSSIAPGNVECELQIYSGESMEVLVTTARFNFEANRAMMNEDVLQGTNEYPLLVDLISTVEGFVSAEEGRVIAEAERVEEHEKWQNVDAQAVTLPAGSAATATVVEEDGVKRFRFGIPEGAAGEGTGDMSRYIYDTNNDGVVDTAENAQKLNGYTAEAFQPVGTYGQPSLTRKAVLVSSLWEGEEAPYTQSVAIAGVSSVVEEQIIVIAPEYASREAYANANIACAEQSENALLFTCSHIPESNVRVSIGIISTVPAVGTNGAVNVVQIDETLTYANGVLGVNTADDVEQDNTLPVTSAAVHTEIGNIEEVMETI